MDEVKSSPHKNSIYPYSVQFVRILVYQNCDESHYWASGTSDTRLVLPYTHSSTRQMLHITWTNNWNKLTNQFPSHNMIQDLPSFDKRYSDTQFVSLTVNDQEITLIRLSSSGFWNLRKKVLLWGPKITGGSPVADKGLALYTT